MDRLLNKVFVSKSVEDTMNIASEFASRLVQGDIVLLSGDLGAGKTVFVKGIAMYFGVSGDRVKSPSFVIMNRYKTIKGFYLVHIDLYRVKGAFDVDLYEQMYGNITLIEWGDFIEEYLDKYYRVGIEYISENERRITIEGFGY